MYNMIKKFDICLMNPPYDNRLHEKFLIKTTEISNIVISVQPTIFINKQNRNRKKYNNIINILKGRLQEIDIIKHRDANDLFNLGNQIQELGIFYIKKHGDLDIDNIGFENKHEKSLFNKITPDNNDKMSLIRSHNWKYINYKEQELKDNYVPVYQWHGGNNCYEAVVVQPEKCNKTRITIIFDNKEQAENFKNSLKTKFVNYYYRNFVVPGDNKILVYMFRMNDNYDEPWTDERFYKEFKLTKEEIDIIEHYK